MDTDERIAKLRKVFHQKAEEAKAAGAWSPDSNAWGIAERWEDKHDHRPKLESQGERMTIAYIECIALARQIQDLERGDEPRPFDWREAWDRAGGTDKNYPFRDKQP